jgi:predicted MFS family arabinose efflux permease
VLRSRIFLGGQAVSMLGDGLAILAIPLLVLQLTRSPMAAVLASLPGSVGYLAAGLPAGLVVDRMNPWLIMICCDVVRGLIFLVLFALTGSKSTAAWQVLALAFAAGTATVFADTALAVTVRDVFAGPRLISANSWLESASQGGQIIGPGLAGLLAAAGLLPVSMLIDAGTFAVSLVTLALARRDHPAQARARAPVTWAAVRTELTSGLRYLAATRLLLTLLVFMLVLNLCLGADKLIVFLARDTLRLPPAEVGLVLAAGGAGGLIGAISTRLTCRLLGPVRAVWAGATLSGVALVVLSAAPSAGLAVAGSALYTWAIIVASVTMRSLRQVLVPRQLLGRVTASWRLGGQGITFCGGLVAGATASAFGGDPRPVLAGAGLLTLCTAVIAWWSALRREEVPAALLTTSQAAAPG